MADITNIINVSLLTGGELASRDNFNIVTMITANQNGPLATSNRYQIYRDQASVASDFGANSQEASFASAFFGTKPNPVNAGGYLVMSYWRGASEDVAATEAVLEGAQVDPATVVAALQNVQDGSFDITVDGVLENITALDFRTSTTLEEIATVIDTALTGADAAVSDQNIVILSKTTGATSTITFASAGASGTFVGDILAISDGSGATITQGAAASTLSAETKLEALAAIKAVVNFKGGMFIDNPTDQESEDIAEWAQANDLLFYDVFNSAANLEVDPTNVVWSIKLSGYENYRMLYSKANNRKLAAAYMARVHTVNFNAENSALTMNLKELSVAAETYTETEISKAKTVGLDIYTTVKLTPAILSSGANGWTDERYNLLAFVDAVQTDMYNLLKSTATKIPQTERGVNQMIDQAEKTTRGFVRAGVFSAGTWTSPDTFGDLDTFNRNIETNGFYWIAGKLSEQPQADREARKSPVLQAAVKGAGAIHSADIIINFNA